MELIQALEQLSLEVRNPQRINSTVEQSPGHLYEVGNSHQLWASTSETDQPTVVKNSSQQCWQYPMITSEGRLHQLQDFDNSIETLLTQITDLDYHKPKFKSHPTLATVHQAGNSHSTGSMYTSLEEDSDCSSQQSSGCSNSNGIDEVHINPLVKDLLKRDISAITDTVRKIGQIISVGSEIEFIYNNISNTNLQLIKLRVKTLDNNDQIINIPYIRSLCEAFISLCSSEPHIRDLPTISRYNDYCYKLLTQLNNDNQDLHLSTNKYQLSDNQFTNEAGYVVSDSVEVNLDDGCNDSDVAFLNCDQRHVDNWTENKLYINHQDKI